MTIRAKIMSTMLLTVAALSLIISVSVYYFAKEVQLSNIDKKLLRWANYSKTTLPDNFHDRIVNKTTVSKKQFDKIVARNNQRCLEMDLQYLWSVLVLDPDTIVFTTSTSPLKDISQNDYAEFFEVHSDPEAFETALKAMKPVFSTFHNKWGYGRMVLVPEYDSKGRVFMFGASVSIDSILAKQKKIAFSALGISFGILLLGFIYSLLLSSFFSKPIVKLSNMADYISRGHFDCTLELKGANELVKLSRTINKMTMTIKKNIQELKESELEGKQYKRMLDYTEDGIFSYKLKDGQILNANRGFIKIFDLNCDPEDLAGKNINEQFFNIENTDLVNETIKKEKRVHNYELHFKTLKGEVRWVVYDSFVVTNKDTHEQIAEAKIRDITAQKKLENEKNTTLKFLNLINKSRSLKELISFAADFIQEESGCGAIGIRLKKDEDYPYFEYRGFADEFILIENSLCSKNGEGEIKRDLKGNPVLECMCGNVICGRFDPSKPFFTKNGSFWSNCIAELPDSTIEENRKANMRNRCKGEQYNSIALIPLTTGNKIFGLLQLNDIRKGMFTLEKITLYENLSGYLGVAAAKFEAEEELEKYRDHLEKLIAERTEQLNKQKERLLLAEQIAHVGSFEWNIRTNSFHMTPELKRIYGIEAEECKETREAWEKLIYPHDRAYVNNLTEQLFQTGAQAEGEWRITRADGNIRWILGRFEIFRDESGRPLFLSGVNFDITQRKHNEQIIRTTQEKLRNSEKFAALGKLASIVAHELRNPLAVIKGSVYYLKLKLKDHIIDEKIKKYIGIISKEVDASNRIITNVLTYGRIKEPDMIKFELNNLIVRIISTAALPENIDVSLNLKPGLPDIIADPLHIEQLLSNLIMNSVEAMPNGGKLTVSTYCIDDNFKIIVRDTGSGIKKEDHSKIFDMDYSTKQTGMGLGLAICQAVVKFHSGNINIKSEVNKGAEIIISLPVKNKVI